MSATTHVPASITTPDTVQTSRLGTLEFNDGAPTPETAERLYDHLDFIRGVEAYLNSIPGRVPRRRSAAASSSVGVEDNQFLIFPELMDSASLFLTANSDTVYFLSFVDLTDGPMVIEVPEMPAPSAILGTIDDMWFRWVTDVGVPGPDRGEGGRYLLVGPGYDGPLPDSGFHVSQVRTTRAMLLGRAFMIDNDPAPAVAAIKAGVPDPPVQAGSDRARRWGASSPAGRRSPAPPSRPRRRFVDASTWRSTRSRRTTSPSGRRSTSSSSRSRPAPATPRSSASSPRRDPQGQAVRARRAHARDPRGGRRRRQRHRAHAVDRAARVGGHRPTTRARRGSTCCGSAATSSWTRRPRSPPTAWCRAPSDGARKLNSRIAFFYPATGDHAGDVHAADRHRLAVPDGHARRRRRVPRRRPQLQAAPARRTSPRAASGRSCSTTARRARCCRPTSRSAPRQPVRHRRAERRRVDRPLLRPAGAGRQGAQLAPDRPGQGLVRDPAALQPAPAVLRQDLAARARSNPTRSAPTATTPPPDD